MLPEQREAILRSSLPTEDTRDISSLFNSPRVKTVNLFKSSNYRHILLHDVPIYVTDKKLRYEEALRMVQCVCFYWEKLVEIAYHYGVDAFKEIGVTTNMDALRKAAPFDYGDMRRGEVYLAFGANESSVLGKEATILVKCYEFNRIYDGFSISSVLSKFKL